MQCKALRELAVSLLVFIIRSDSNRNAFNLGQQMRAKAMASLTVHAYPTFHLLLRLRLLDPNKAMLF